MIYRAVSDGKPIQYGMCLTENSPLTLKRYVWLPHQEKQFIPSEEVQVHKQEHIRGITVLLQLPSLEVTYLSD